MAARAGEFHPGPHGIIPARLPRRTDRMRLPECEPCDHMLAVLLFYMTGCAEVKCFPAEEEGHIGGMRGMTESAFPCGCRAVTVGLLVKGVFNVLMALEAEAGGPGEQGET